jgi:hypothetical protein
MARATQKAIAGGSAVRTFRRHSIQTDGMHWGQFRDIFEEPPATMKRFEVLQQLRRRAGLPFNQGDEPFPRIWTSSCRYTFATGTNSVKWKFMM